MAHLSISLPAVVIIAALMLRLSATSGATPVIGMPGCDTTCGDMSVPYPFGIGPERCYHSVGFNLTCDTSSNPPRLLLGDGTLRVIDIDSEMSAVTAVYVGGIKFDADGNGKLSGGLRDDGPFGLSRFPNELTLMGCNVQATLKNGNITMSSCSSLCQDGIGLVDEEPLTSPTRSLRCSGWGCCQADIIIDHEEVEGKLVPITSYDVELKWLGWNRSADNEWPVTVFVARSAWFGNRWLSGGFSPTSHSPSLMEVPLWIGWEVLGHGVESHNESDYLSLGCPLVCKSNHSRCENGARGGYTCFCEPGYEGNPYMGDGCQDIDECKHPEIWSCYGNCTNTEGWYECLCPVGTQGNPGLPGGCYISLEASCSRSCGGVTVPFPFGVGPSECYWEGFGLTCDATSKPPRLLLLDDQEGTLQVNGISLVNNTVRVLRTGGDSIAGPEDGLFMDVGSIFTGTGERPYSLSSGNELILVGCNVQATLFGDGNRAIISGCASFCPITESGNTTSTNTGIEPINGTDKYCYGMGCCQARIPISAGSMPKHLVLKKFDQNNAQQESPLSYMLIAEEGWFNHGRVSSEVLQQPPPIPHTMATRRTNLQVPMLLRWEVVKGLPRANKMKSQSNCPREVARKLCKSKNSYCKSGNRGYSCQCSDDYHGNPYVTNGCQGRNIVIGVASGVGIILLVLIAFFILKYIKHQRAQMMKRKYFDQNRGQLLEQLVSQRADIAERMIIKLEELEKATNNFDKARELGGGGHGIVYKGILSDLNVVAIKKPKKVVQKEIDEFINEVAILSQINHRNVVKLYGCCLETEVPMLVYEFISNGTLYDHLHVEGSRSLSWNNRLRIATETAKSLAYLHSTASVPIIHRDIKSVNILLDDTLRAKVADFGASRYIAVEKSGLTTMVQGTIGYLDPMYFYTGRLTEKSDVYSFGVMVVELLTRKKPFSYISSEGDGLVAHFAILFAEHSLSQILDPQVVDEGSTEVQEVAALAVACIQLKGEDRPTMRQVELTLERLQSSNQVISYNVVDEEFVEDGIKINYPLSPDGRRGEDYFMEPHNTPSSSTN
ncbi:wall-associated receptor kinase 5-like [Triticum dicoccoides]|uniref:wall-associated receptor kinase 5-like n=1 Tax=Triticum dicoccoides TaxID=85692 RepID=UPI00188F333C|nr:wall-associated receptor kinase 5-like [Triticum dicoccoides]